MTWALVDLLIEKKIVRDGHVHKKKFSWHWENFASDNDCYVIDM